MEKRPAVTVRCECGFVASGSEDEAVEAMQDHAVSAHNMKPTREQILERAEKA